MTTDTASRNRLRALAEFYLDALGRRDASALPLSTAARFTENGVALAMGEGFWRTAGPASDYRVYAIDPEAGQVAVHANMTEAGALVPFLLRLKVEGGEISEVETVITRDDGSPIFAPQTLRGEPALFAASVPADRQATRESLRDVADSYFTALSRQGEPDYKRAPIAPGANRIENGLQTTNVALFGHPPASINEQLESGVFKGIDVIDRRYPVVDRDHGVVLAIVRFGGIERSLLGTDVKTPDAPRPTSTAPLITEMFKITDGRIDEIRAVMIMLPASAPTGWE